MSAKHMFGALALGLIAASAGGCANAAPHATTVVEEEIIVRQAPPTLREEVITVRPGPAERFVWQPGHWRWNAPDYDWVAGRWVERPSPRHEWVAPHWRPRRDGAWVFVPGRWRH